MIYYNIKEEPFDVYGLYNYKSEPEFKRLPDKVAESTNEAVKTLAKNTAGGRIKFRTNTTSIALRAVMRELCDMPHMPRTGSAGFDLYVKTGTKYIYYKTFIPENFNKGFEAVHTFPDARERELLIHFPLYNDVVSVELGLCNGATLSGGEKYRYGTPVVYYGSSITQGGCASRPGNSYQAIISRRYDCDYVNLGFSGSARGEQIMASYIASLSMSVFVMDYDHNTPDPEYLSRTHEPFFRTIREKHPDLPVIFISAPDFDADPLAYALRRDVVYNTYLNALKSGDRNVAFIDGASLFAGENRDACTVDSCHPNDLGFLRMADRIGEAVGRFLKE